MKLLRDITAFGSGFLVTSGLFWVGDKVLAQPQPPSAWYVEIHYERSGVEAEAYMAIHQGPAARDRAIEDAQGAVRDGACLRSERELGGGAVYIDPPLCIPAARIVSAQAVPYEEPH